MYFSSKDLLIKYNYFPQVNPITFLVDKAPPPPNGSYMYKISAVNDGSPLDSYPCTCT